MVGAVIYVRVSTKEQTENLSLPTQLRACEAIADGVDESPIPKGLRPGPGCVAETITGKAVKIISYQLIIEKDVDPHRHMIGKLGLSIYVPRNVTSIDVPDGFLAPKTIFLSDGRSDI